MYYICESRYSDGVVSELYGEIKETFVCSEDDIMHLIGWILLNIADGCDISIIRRYDTWYGSENNDYGKEGVNNNTES